jgi:subtilisin-like proprotein convertase family protein
VLSANPNLTASEVRDILQSTADKIVDDNPDAQLGHAFGAYDGNGHSQWFGFGKVNAARAVQEAVGRRPGGDSQALRKASAPGLAIPDNNNLGVRDVIPFSESAIVAALRVHVDVTHSYRGDLRLTLIAPSGGSVVLHQTSNNSAANIQGTFDLASTPALASLTNESVQGDWTLHVQDLAALDVGTLNRWELEIEARANTPVELEESPSVPIPDNNPAGIERILAVAATGLVDLIEVSVDITHTFIRDLIVTLVSPTGMTARLHQRSGGASDDIEKTYTPATTPDLQALHGLAVQGDWRLQVSDMEAVDVGTLNRWALKIVRLP